MPLADGTFEDYDWELDYLWGRFSQARYAAGFVGLSRETALAFATWLQDQLLGDVMREEAAAWGRKRTWAQCPGNAS